MGELEILIAPSNGVFSSSRRKIDPETDSAQTSKAATTVALRGANNPKLRNMTATQKISTAINTGGIGLSAWAINSQRVCARSPLSDSARVWSQRCASVRGDSSRSFAGRLGRGDRLVLSLDGSNLPSGQINSIRRGWIGAEDRESHGLGPVARQDAIQQDSVCGGLLDLAPQVVERIGCESISRPSTRAASVATMPMPRISPHPSGGIAQISL